MERRERADAARNRRAILDATEALLARQRPETISMELVAAEAGVGKGTVFHRFGSRMGLMVALAQERALGLREAVESGPPPLGPGASPAERLPAFLDAAVDVVVRNKNLLAALGHAEASAPHDHGDLADHPVYRFWHAHVVSLLTGDDTDALAHVVLAGLRSGPVIAMIDRGEAERVKRALRTIVSGLVG
ncbi:TetR/AcrR family transcriptional regulator [Cryptosporangium arvum]|uniref:Transcriptional regulator n=1 Tax=Cryptosporangium arvum DSM 44712 TaxID=927661 RepID=A0A010Z2C5_9ACTN|nr:TetR/AcrR family transcriptional regulator [Cryptosporangium arvum]EXG81578.1 transcriptional regulator [Cryptosporangium arvum DSM 44712]